MAPQDLLFDLLSRAIVLSFPIAVGVLAFRRLLLSQTLNVWVYALAVGYAGFSTVGLMPWAIGLQPVSTTFIILAVLCPPLWLAIVVICGIGRTAPYDLDFLEETQTAETEIMEPLLLKNPIIAEPVPVFRHHRRRPELTKTLTSDVVNVARSMRGRTSSEARRVRKLLPPPAPENQELPFLR